MSWGRRQREDNNMQSLVIERENQRLYIELATWDNKCGI
jgi:hypothetical protein